MTDPHRDTERINTPCGSTRIFHRWIWVGGAWTCSQCGSVAHRLRFSDQPCIQCGRPVKSIYGVNWCDECLDAKLAPLDNNDVPFDEKYYAEEILP